MADANALSESLPRPARIAALVVGAILLTATFLYLGFPYPQLFERMKPDLEEATGFQLEWATVSASPQILGPGVSFEALRARRDRTSFDFERLRARPAWSPAWLALTPSIHVSGDGGFGSIAGALTGGDEPGFDGELLGIDVTQLIRMAQVRFATSGRIDLDADVRMPTEGLVGSLDFVARDGVLGHPRLPLDVPYTEITGELELGGETRAAVRRIEIASPMGAGTIQGTIGQGRSLAESPLDLQVEIRVRENMVSALQAQRVRVSPDGTLSFTIAGTFARPIVR